MFGLERLVESNALSEWVVTEILARNGWRPAFVAPHFAEEPAGSHVLTIEKYGSKFRAVGTTRQEAVQKAMEEATRIEAKREERRRAAARVPLEELGQLTIDDELQTWEEWFESLSATA